ncbi:hypothetical protein J6590_107536, partial [Homalodisca vitripennis]
ARGWSWVVLSYPASNPTKPSRMLGWSPHTLEYVRQDVGFPTARPTCSIVCGGLKALVTTRREQPRVKRYCELKNNSRSSLLGDGGEGAVRQTGTDMKDTRSMS